MEIIVQVDSASAAKLREKREALAILVGELRSGRLRHHENGVDLSGILIAGWTAEIGRIEDRLQGAGN